MPILPNLTIAPELAASSFRCALVAVDLPCALGEYPLTAAVTNTVHALIAEGRDPARAHRQGVLNAELRNMIRHGKFKPAGVSKPSNEYLFLQSEFPIVNVAVDLANAFSVACGLPLSIFDRKKAGMELHARYGCAGEKYVFNASGQAIDLEDLVVVCRKSAIDGESLWEPIINPVKDSMATKVFDDCWQCAIALYAPASLGANILESCAERLALLFAATLPGAESAWMLP